MKETGKYSFGIDERFLHQGKAQLEDLIKASDTLGIKITPVWNKSKREHNILHSEVASELRTAYTGALEANAEVIAGCVKENIYDRHIIPLYTF
jgi:hypothetical protein